MQKIYSVLVSFLFLPIAMIGQVSGYLFSIIFLRIQESYFFDGHWLNNIVSLEAFFTVLEFILHMFFSAVFAGYFAAWVCLKIYKNLLRNYSLIFPIFIILFSSVGFILVLDTKETSDFAVFFSGILSIYFFNYYIKNKTDIL